MPNHQFSQFPGRVKIESILLEKSDGTRDITEFFLEFNINASIIDPTAILTLSLLDAKNILGHMPIESGDRVVCNVSYLDGPKTFKARVNRIKNIKEDGKQRAYVVECISELAFNSLFQKISQHFEGTPSEIAKSIYDQFTFEEVGIWDQAANTQSLIVPFWSPLKTIRWLAGRSRAYFDDVLFRFWQDSNMRYNFVPIEKSNELYAQSPITYRYNNVTNREVRGDDTAPNSRAAVETILSLEYFDCFDIQEAVARLKNARWNVDLTENTTRIVTYDHWRNFNQKNYLNVNPMWAYSEYGLGRHVIDPVATRGIESRESNDLEDVAMNRKTALFDAQGIEIAVHGNQTVDVGQVVTVEIPSPEPRTTGMPDQLDLRWSGRYYVVGVRHMYNRDGQQTALTLSKESLMV